MHKKLISIVVVLLILIVLAGCSNGSDTVAQDAQAGTNSSQGGTPAEQPAGDGLRKLTQEDVLGMFSAESQGQYMDKTMDEPMQSSDFKDVILTEEEKDQIRQMDLKVGFEYMLPNDAFKQHIAGVRSVLDEVGVEVTDIWASAEQTPASQLEDFQKMEAVAENYDCFIFVPQDAATQSDIINKMMEKTSVVTLCSIPYDVDWANPNWGGCVDMDGYLAGKMSAEAAIKILNGSGKLGVLGGIGGKEGHFNSLAERYRGWFDVFDEHPEVETVQVWWDDPTATGDLIQSMLASDPEIKTLLIDYANPPAISAESVFQQLGRTAWDDIAMVTIDLDDLITVPMAITGPDNNYTAAYITSPWYAVGKYAASMWLKGLVTDHQSPKFVTIPPLPVTVYDNVKTTYEAAVPEDWDFPEEVLALENQWELGVDNIW